MKRMLRRFLNSNLHGEEKKYNEIKLLEMVMAVLFIIFGIVLLSNKTMSDSAIAIFLGILLIIKAGLNIYSTITENSNSLFKLNIIFGVLYIIVAILLFTNFINFVNYISIYFGLFLSICGVKELINAIRLKMIKEESFLITLIMSIMTLALGILVIFYPFASFGPIDTIAIFAILYGILKINISNLLRNRVTKFLSKVDNI